MRPIPILAFMLGFVLTVLTANLANADPDTRRSSSRETTASSVVIKARVEKERTSNYGDEPGDPATTRPQPTYLPKDEYEKRIAAWRARQAAALRINATRDAAVRRCLEGTGGCVIGTYADIEDRPNIAVAGDPAPAVPEVPPEVIAYQALARLTLAPPRPVIGPPPEINRWKTAVVGYPLWLSVSGDPTPPPVSDRVFDVSVSLRARLDRVVFDLGDGTRVSCNDASHPWSRSVGVGEGSPWCGHTYTKVPRGSATYPVTAYAVWSVTWQINQTTGTLPFYQQSTVRLPVSELQVLVR